MNSQEEIVATPLLKKKEWIPLEQAIQRVVDFERQFGPRHLALACHAALPSILNPELINLIRINFLEKDVEWVAEVDLLLSALCYPIGQDIFEVEPQIRRVLLVALKSNPTYGIKRLEDIARFLRNYIDTTLIRKIPPYIVRIYQWISDAYLAPDEAVDTMFHFLKDIKPEELVSRLTDYIHVGRTIELVADALERTNLQVELQDLLNGTQHLIRYWYGEKEDTVQALQAELVGLDNTTSELSISIINWMLTTELTEKSTISSPLTQKETEKVPRPYREIPNPYTSGAPIRDRQMFYGRRKDIDILYEKLSGATANKVVVLLGQRRTGKTSLVYQLANRLIKGPQTPVIIDLQAQALQNMGQLFLGIAMRIYEELQRSKHITLDQPDREAFFSNPTESFDAFLTNALQTVGEEKIVLLLDEFEVLQEKVNKGPLNEDVLHYLRSLVQHRQGLNLLLIGAPRIRHITGPSWSIFFNIAITHKLSKLEQSEAQLLITEPIGDYLEYDMLALERIHRLSGDIPYFIHILSEILIAYSNKKHKSYVTVNDINNVLEMVLEKQSSSIQWIWNQITSPLEHFLLSVLAQDKDEDGRLFTLTDISAEFDAQGIPYEHDKVIEALQNLIREDIVAEFRNGPQYQLPIGLVKEWLRKMKPPERVIRDEPPFDR